MAALAAGLIAGMVAIGVLCVTCTIGQIVTVPYFGILTSMIYLMATGQSHSARTLPSKPLA